VLIVINKVEAELQPQEEQTVINRVEAVRQQLIKDQELNPFQI
jgi:hypothetical protein